MDYVVIVEQEDTSFGAYVPELAASQLVKCMTKRESESRSGLQRKLRASICGNAQPHCGVRIATIMSGKVIITTPYPTPEWIAAYYKIPPKRVAELRQMMDEIRGRRGGEG